MDRSLRIGFEILFFFFIFRVLLMRESGSWSSSYRVLWFLIVNLSMCRILLIGLFVVKLAFFFFLVKSW